MTGKLREVFKRPGKTAWLMLRVLPTEKEAIRQAARRVGRSMSAYLLELHRYAVGAGKRDA